MYNVYIIIMYKIEIGFLVIDNHYLFLKICAHLNLFNCISNVCFSLLGSVLANCKCGQNNEKVHSQDREGNRYLTTL